MKNRIIPMLLAMTFLLCIIGLPAFAVESVDLNRKGTITVQPRREYGEISGEVTLYRVADMKATSGGYEFVYTGDFADANLPLDDLESPELAVFLAMYAQNHDVEGDTGTFRNNSATFSATAGLYLVVHTGAEEGENTFIPFLVVFPGTEKNQPDYDVTACPKTGPVPDWPDCPTEPEGTEPDWTEPEETEPDSTEPDGTEPDTTEPDATEPEGTEPEPTQPGSTEPEETPPDDEEKLPQTGQLNWPVPLMAVAGMSLFAAGWVLRFRDRKEDYDA